MKRIASLILFLLVTACAGNAWATTWGPTATSFNYYAVDTVAEGGNSYNWRTVNNPAKNIQYGFTAQHDDSFESDDTSSAPTPLPIGFNFRFFGRVYTGVYISTNGALHLVNDDNAGKYQETDPNNSPMWDMTAGALPRFAADNTVIPTIGVWMEDMTCLNAQLMYGINSAGVSELVVTWQNMAYYSANITSQIICQAVLRSDGTILLQYYSTLNETDGTNGNADPGVGICGPDPLGNTCVLTCYTRASNADGYPSTYTCITFVPPPPPPTITVIHPNGGETFYTGDFLTISWTVTNGPLPGADIALSTDGGFTWNTIATNVPDNIGGTYSWTIVSPPSTQCLIRVSDTNTPTTLDVSDNVFTIKVAPPGFTITNPSGTGKLDYMIGETMHITWVAKGAVGNANLYISRDYGISWTQINTTPINPKLTNFYDWVVTAPHTDGVRKCFIKIDDGQGNFAVSSPPFAIFDTPVFQVTYPNGGETVYIDTPTKILWNTQGLVGFFVTIELSRDGGINWETVSGGTNNDGDFDWIPTAPVSTNCKIRITTSYGGVTYTDTTDGLFTISETAALAVTSPNGGESYTVGERVSITWNSRGSGVGNFIKIDISRDAGQTWETIADNAQNIGYYSWVVTGPITDRALVRISPVNNPAASDVSDAVFTITAPRGIYLLSPVGGEAFYVGEVVDIKWFTSGNTGLTADIELSRDGGQTWETIISDTPNDGNHTWVVSAPLSENCLIKISSVTYPEFVAVTPAPFRISELIGTNIIEPFRGEIWETGTYRRIRWKPASFSGESGPIPLVRIEVFRSGAGWEVVAVQTENDGIYDWFVSGVDPACRVRISSLENLAKNYTSDTFSIIEKYSLPYDTFGMDATGECGEPVAFRVVLNPSAPFATYSCVLHYDPAVFSVPEPLAVEKGGAFTGWVMDVQIDNDAGTLRVTLSGNTQVIFPAEAFTVHFNTSAGAPAGDYDITFDPVTFDGEPAAGEVLAGKVTLTAVGGGSENVTTTGGGGGGCFIATAAFGTYLAGDVETLCSFRDSRLGASSSGAELVSLYYAVSPAVAGDVTPASAAVLRKFISLLD